MADQISEHEDALIELFLCLDLADLAVCSRVCRRWHALLSNGNSSIWENQFYVLVPEKMQKSELLDALPSYQAKVQAYCFAWNPNDCSKNISIKADGFTFHRRPVPQSTDAARTRKGFTSGRHCWEVWWEKPFGSHALVGVATQNAPLQQRGYISLVGMNRFSWGWNLSDNKLWHGGKTVGSYPRNLAITCQKGERVRAVLDMERGTLSFEKGDRFLGVAFADLPTDAPLYPIVSSVYGETEVCLIYKGCPLDG